MNTKFAIFLAGVLAAHYTVANAQTALIDAVKAKDSAAVKQLVRDRSAVNQAAQDGTTALHYAAYYGDAAMVKQLLKAGANPSVVNSYGSSPMTEAATRGDLEVIELLVKAGADVDSPNPEGQTALMAVARTGNLEAAKYLLKKGANINATENWGGQTALMWAASEHHPAMVKLLLDNGADPNIRATVRNWGRRVTSEPRIKELHAGGLTALLFAAREGCVECAQHLVEGGADIDMSNPEGITPLIMALINMKFDTAAWLVKAGANPNRWDWWGRTPLYAAIDLNVMPRGGRRDLPTLDKTTGLEVARMLLEAGANPNLQLKNLVPPRAIVLDRDDELEMTTGATPLLRAAYGADVEAVKLLLEHGALVNLPNKNSMTPLLGAAVKGGTRAPNKSEEAIVATMDLLLAAGADINDQNRNGKAALHTAARMNWLQVVRYLGEHGAKLDIQDINGRTPLDYASGKADVVEFGLFDVVGELPDMMALINELKAGRGSNS